MAAIRSACGSTAFIASRRANPVIVEPCTSRARACIGCKLCSWACPYGAREYDYDAGVMKKCTLCIDKIYNENLDAVDRVPACVATCPTSARHFGDLGDPNSDISKLVRDRGGYDLMPEMGYLPTNKYLAPRLSSHPFLRNPLAGFWAGLIACYRAEPPCIRLYRSSSSPPYRGRATAFCSGSVFT